jgi:hypothetical protein
MPGTINKIITLDTGHLGFGLANFVDRIWKSVTSSDLPLSLHCSEDAEEGSKFITDLNKEFNPNNPKLASFAACNQMPVPLPPLPQIGSIRVVDFHSSSMLQVPDSANCNNGNYNNLIFKILPYHHASIPQITNHNDNVY